MTITRQQITGTIDRYLDQYPPTGQNWTRCSRPSTTAVTCRRVRLSQGM